MAANDVTVTPANVSLISDAQTREIIFGETVTPGAWVYKNKADDRFWLTDANSAGTADPDGESGYETLLMWSLSGGVAGEKGIGVLSGVVDVGGALTKGRVYVLSDTRGVITLANDLTSGWWSTVAGVAATTSHLKIIGFASGYQLA